MIEKVLVPLDDSELTEAILPYVTQLTSGLGVPMLLLTVVDWTFPGGRGRSSLYGPLYEPAMTKARTRLRVVADRLTRDGVHVETMVSTGRPSEEIVRIAEQKGCGLIAMSTHGRNMISRAILGSVTDQVVHSSTVPVLTLTREKAEIFRDRDTTLDTMTVPLDGTEFAERVLPHVEELSQKLSMKIHLVRVVEPLHLFWMDHVPPGLEDEQELIEAEARAYLESIAQGLREKGLDVECDVLIGHPATSLIDLALKEPRDLVALATHARSGIKRWAIGSVAEALVRGTGDPVLLVPPQR